MLGNNFLINILITAPLLVICFTVHELSHGLAAYALGDNTAKRDGRLSLNPLRHIDWIGFILLMTAGFGWAKPVPVNPSYFKNPKRGMAITALAGPMSNMVLAFICGIILVKVPMHDYLKTAVFLLVAYNCSLAMFNLLPIPPLDGSKILGAFLPDNIYYKYLMYERYGMIIMIILLYTGFLTPVLSNGRENLINLIFVVIEKMGIG